MPLTTIDDTALIVVDLQKGILNLPAIHPISGVIERSRALIDAFRRHGLPVVLVNVAVLLPAARDSRGVMPHCPKDSQTYSRS